MRLGKMGLPEVMRSRKIVITYWSKIAKNKHVGLPFILTGKANGYTSVDDHLILYPLPRSVVNQSKSIIQQIVGIIKSVNCIIFSLNSECQ